MYKVFIEEFSSRPLLGWGPGRSRQLLQKTTYPGLADAPHFHNIFVEILIQLGLIGLLLFTAMFTILFKTALTRPYSAHHSTKFRWFLLCSAAVFCLTGLINNTLWSSATPYFFALTGGLAYAPRAGEYVRATP